MEWPVILALVFAIPIILFPAAYVWYLNIGGIYTAVKEAQRRRAAGTGWQFKSLATIGRTMKIVLPIAIPIVIYGSLIWFFLASFGWEIALALGLAIPFILIPVAFIWYLNVSGLYQVIRDVRRRQKRRAEVLRETGEIIEDRAIANAGTEAVGPRRAA